MCFLRWGVQSGRSVSFSEILLAMRACWRETRGFGDGGGTGVIASATEYDTVTHHRCQREDVVLFIKGSII